MAKDSVIHFYRYTITALLIFIFGVIVVAFFMLKNYNLSYEKSDIEKLEMGTGSK